MDCTEESEGNNYALPILRERLYGLVLALKGESVS
jgi:hypothetical protein